MDWAYGRGGRPHGRDAVAGHWADGWSRALVHDHPVTFARRADGAVAVQVEQVVRHLDGSTPTATSSTHVHRLVDGQIARLDLEPLPDRADQAPRARCEDVLRAQTRPSARRGAPWQAVPSGP